jgi:hypothetical protein
MNMPTPIATPQSPEPKRASPVPEPETAALRAVRNVRQLNEQIARIKSKAEVAMTEKANERDAIVAALSPAAKEIFDTLTKPAGKKAPNA